MGSCSLAALPQTMSSLTIPMDGVHSTIIIILTGLPKMNASTVGERSSWKLLSEAQEVTMNQKSPNLPLVRERQGDCDFITGFNRKGGAQ